MTVEPESRDQGGPTLNEKLDFAQDTLVDVLEQRASADPDAELLRFDDGVPLRLGELDACARAVEARIAPLVTHGTAVATCLVPSGKYVELIFGLARSGAVEVPLALDVTTEAAQVAMAAAGAETLIVGTTALCANESLTALLEIVPTVILVGERDAPIAPGIPILDDLPPTTPHSPRRPRPGDPLAILTTSGTTGRPKGAILPHFAAVRHARRVRETMGYGPSDVLFNVFPWNHINVRHAALLPALLSGARLVSHRRFSASGFWETCRAEGVTAFNFMGSMLAVLDRQPPETGDTAHAVRSAYGAPAPVELVHSFDKRFGVSVLEAYACTELGDVASNTRSAWRPGTAGKIVPEYEVAVLDEDGDALPAGLVGQIAVRARLPHMTFSGYASDSDATARVLDRGWFHTGDRGSFDSDGYLTFAGRRADVVRRRGENIATWDVEQVLRAMPGVTDAAAVGVPSELTEEEILVVLDVSAVQVDGPAVRDWCRARLPRHAVPRFVRIAGGLPRNTNGKVVKSVLAERGVDGTTWDSHAADA